MCGIAGVYIKDLETVQDHGGLERFLDHLLLNIEQRGKQATGFVAVTDKGEVRIDKAPIGASEFIKERERLPKGTKIILAHTRWATKGDIENHQNNHPVISGTCFTTHNGTVKNDDALFEEHGVERHAQVDTEIIPAIANKYNMDVEKMIAAFSNMEGSIACATIDPIRHPNKVVLTRTLNSPLVFIETKKFLLWASTYDALKETWGTCLGTPPSKKCFTDVGIRTMLVVTDEGIEKHNIPYVYKSGVAKVPTMDEQAWGGHFDHARRPNVRHIPKATQKALPQHAQSQIDDMHTDPEELKEAVRAIRKEGGGRVRTWTDRAKHWPDADERLGFEWRWCGGCGESLYSEDFVKTLAGDRCLDCADMRLEIYRAKIKRAEDKAKEVEDWGLPFKIHRVHAFNTWSEDDDFVHTEIMEDMGKKHGLFPEAVEFILFRMMKEDADQVPGMWDFRLLLVDEYDAAYIQYWQFHEEDGYDKWVEILNPPPLPVTEKVEEGEWKNLTKRTTRKTTDGKCLCCKRKAKRHIVRSLTSEALGYCNRHFDKCHAKGCRAAPNHTTHDGLRYCHQHARKRERVYADTLLTQEGYIVGVDNGVLQDT